MFSIVIKSNFLIGFGIFFLENNQVKSINFDLIWADEPHSGKSVVRGFRMLRQQEFFKKIEKNNYIIWSDTGTHFRCNEVVTYLLIELAQLNIKGFFFFFF